MPAAFEEWAGSPTLRTDRAGGFYATRVFKVAWSDTVEFYADLYGVEAPFGGPVAFPGIPMLIVKEASFDPFPEDSIVTAASSTLTGNTNQPLYAKVTVTYDVPQFTNGQSPSSQGGEPGPDTGTFISEEFTSAAEILTIPGRGLKWQSGGQKLPEDKPGGVLIPKDQLVVSWDRVPYNRIPFSAIQAAKGKLNNATFYGYPAGCVLFSSHALSRQFGLDGRVTCQLRYTFDCVIKQATAGSGGPYGWNYLWNDKPLSPSAEHWSKAVTAEGGKTMYAEDGNFNTLFRLA